PGQVVAMLVEELADAEEELGPLRNRQRAPGGEGCLRSLDGEIDLLGRREVDRAGLRAGRRVEDLPDPSRSALVAAAANAVVDRLHGLRRVNQFGHLSPPPSPSRQRIAWVASTAWTRPCPTRRRARKKRRRRRPRKTRSHSPRNRVSGSPTGRTGWSS